MKERGVGCMLRLTSFLILAIYGREPGVQRAVTPAMFDRVGYRLLPLFKRPASSFVRHMGAVYATAGACSTRGL